MAVQYGTITICNNTRFYIQLSFRNDDGSDVKVTGLNPMDVVTQLTPIGATWSLTTQREFTLDATQSNLYAKLTRATDDGTTVEANPAWLVNPPSGSGKQTSPARKKESESPGEVRLDEGVWRLTLRYAVVADEAESVYTLTSDTMHNELLMRGYFQAEPEVADAFGTRRS